MISFYDVSEMRLLLTSGKWVISRSWDKKQYSVQKEWEIGKYFDCEYFMIKWCNNLHMGSP